MRKLVLTAAGAALIALSITSAASATERHRARHVTQQPAVGATDPRDAFGYYPGWGRERVPSYGVYPGLIYGGAISAPAGR
ncbi:MAG: hypothetical protein ABWY82_09750 [Tardiphaga sp.]